MLRDGDEDAGRQGHVKDSVSFFSPLLDLQNVFVKLLERCILVVLAGDVGADGAELFELFLNFLCRGFYV